MVYKIIITDKDGNLTEADNGKQGFSFTDARKTAREYRKQGKIAEVISLRGCLYADKLS